MQKSTNYGLNLPDLADQFNLNHWNENTEKLDLELKKETDSRINNDNQLQSNINNSVSTLRSEISTAETNAKNLANATGVLPIAKGGTGATDAKNGFMSLANGLTQSQNPQDAEYMIYKSSDNWGLYTLLQFWEYIKSKISSVLGLTASEYNGNAKTATKTVHWSAENSNFTGNLNDLEIGRWYSVNTSETTVSNAPDKDGWASVLTFSANDNSEYKQQLCMYTYGGTIYTRTSIRNAWSSWERLETNTESNAKNMIHTCSTANNTVAKTVSVTGFTLATGACIRVLFANGNNVANPTLNVNNTGAKEIRVNVGGTIKPLSSDYGNNLKGAYYWKQNVILELYYTGAYWVVMNDTIVAEFTNDDWHHEELYISGRKKIWGYLQHASSVTTVTFTYMFGESKSYSLVTGAYKESDNNFGGILIKEKTPVSFKYTTAWAEGTDKNASGYFIAEGF